MSIGYLMLSVLITFVFSHFPKQRWYMNWLHVLLFRFLTIASNKNIVLFVRKLSIWLESLNNKLKINKMSTHQHKTHRDFYNSELYINQRHARFDTDRYSKLERLACTNHRVVVHVCIHVYHEYSVRICKVFVLSAFANFSSY